MREIDRGTILFAGSFATSNLCKLLRGYLYKSDPATLEAIALVEVIAHLIWYVGYIDSNVDEIKCASLSALAEGGLSMNEKIPAIIQPMVHHIYETKNYIKENYIPDVIHDGWHKLVELPDYLPARGFVGFLPAIPFAVGSIVNYKFLNDFLLPFNKMPAEGTVVGKYYNILVNYVWEYAHTLHHATELVDLMENHLTYNEISPIDYYLNQKLVEVKTLEIEALCLDI